MLGRDRFKWIAGAAACVLAAGAWSKAEAGNLNLPTAQYYSVVLRPGESFRYTGSEEHAVLTVDDITYTTQIDPCTVYSRCDFFCPGDVGVMNMTIGNPLGSSSSGVSSAGYGTTTSFFMHTMQWTGFVVSRGAFLRLEMQEGPLGAGVIFDAVSHSLYGQWIEKTYKEEKAGSSETYLPTERQIIEPGMPAPGTASPTMTSSATDTIAATDAVGYCTWAVPTSESRHYQSPQIVQLGNQGNWNRVMLVDGSGAAGYGVYSDASAMVKGRVWFGTSCGPVENFDVTVSNP